jgi:multidrug efflux pump
VKRINLSTWALMQHQMVRYLMVILLLGGGYAFWHLGQAEDPSFTFRTMSVRVNWPGASAREMDQEIASRLEKKLREIPNVDLVEGSSEPGKTVLLVNLRDDISPTQVADGFYQVRKRVGDMVQTLPQGIRGPYFDDEFGATYGAIYAFTGDGFTPIQLKEYAERTRHEIQLLDQVAQVNVIGAQAEKIYVEFDNAKLFTLGIDPLLIISALQAQNSIAAPADMETSSDRVTTRISGDFRSLENIRDVGIRVNGRNFRLGDVTRIYRGYADPDFKMRYMGREAIGLEVAIRPGGDIIALGKSLEQTMRRIKPEFPLGLEIHQIADQPKVVGNAVKLFMQSLGEALLIVLAVSFLSLGLRAGLVVAFSIPLVLAITFIFMWAFGISLQRVSLGALIISLGLLVDDAMIAVEMMVVRLAKGWHSLRAAAYAFQATAFPMLTGTLITAAGFMPVGLAKSGAGEYTFSIFAVVTTALLASWIVAVFFTPYLGFLLLNPKQFTRQSKGLYNTPFYNKFRQLVGWCIDHRWVVIASTLVIFVISALGFHFVEQQFFPISDRTEIVIDAWLPAGASFNATQIEVEKIERKLASDPRVMHYSSYVGGGTPHFFLALVPEELHSNYAALVISAKDVPSRDALYHSLRTYLETELPNVRARISRLESGPPVGYPVQFRVLGEDPAILRSIADTMATAMRKHPKTQEIYSNWNEVIKTVKFEVDQDKARVLGISSRDISNTVNTMLQGMAVTQYREKDELIDVVMRAGDLDRNTLSDLLSMGVRTASGKFVPLSQIATLNYGFEEAKIWHRNGALEITVRADITSDVQAPDVTQQLEPVMRSIAATLPAGYRIETGGATELTLKSQQSIINVVPLMLITIFTLLILQLRGVSGSFRVLVSAPLGIIGVTAALLVFRQPFGFVAMLGVIALAGIIMRNSVILVELIERRMKSKDQPRRAIIEAAVRRFRPISLTAAATVLAMIPLSQSTFWRPMAVAMMGGALIATLLTLVFEPAMYAAWFRIKPKSFVPAATPITRSDASGALLHAAANGELDVCLERLSAGTNPNTKDQKENTPLMLAAQNGHTEVCAALIAAGADVNAAKSYGTRALMHAALNGHLAICKMLIAAGADVHASKNNVSALTIAERKGHSDIAHLLRAAGAEAS